MATMAWAGLESLGALDAHLSWGASGTHGEGVLGTRIIFLC